MKFVAKCKVVLVVWRLGASLHRYRDGLFGGAFVYLGARRRPPLIRFTPHFPTNPFFPVRHALSSPWLPWLCPLCCLHPNEASPRPLQRVYLSLSSSYVTQSSRQGSTLRLRQLYISCDLPRTGEGGGSGHPCYASRTSSPLQPSRRGRRASSVWLTGPNRTEVGACSSLAEA